MSTVIRHQEPVRVQMRDAAMKDMLLTTSARLTAEPSPPMPDLGVRQTGMGTERGAPGVQGAWAKIQKEVGLLSPAEVEEIKRIMAKYSASNVSISEAGISSKDKAPSDTRKFMESIKDQVLSNLDLEKAHATHDQLAAMNTHNRAFWDRNGVPTADSTSMNDRNRAFWAARGG